MSDYDVQAILAGAYDLQGLRQRALAIPEVSAVEGWFTTQVTRVRPDNVQSENITFNGVPANSIVVTPTMMTGHWLEPLSAENRYDVVITDTLLDNERGIELGGTITLRLRGQDQDWRVVGIVDADKRPGEAGVMYGAYDSVARFSGMPDHTNVLMLKTTERAPEVQDQVAEAMAEVLDNLDVDFVNIKTSFDFVETILGASIVIVGLLMVTAVMIALVGGLGLTGTMSLNVLERTREIGVMRAVGASTNTLRLMLVSEGVLVGLISMIFALLLSIPVTLGFGTALGNTFRGSPLTFIYSPVGPVLWLFIILAVSAVASLMPAQRATKISVREAISYE
jgi:putative ABC transport system permease protein